jgi:hypothetical protein
MPKIYYWSAQVTFTYLTKNMYTCRTKKNIIQIASENGRILVEIYIEGTINAHH